MRLQVAQRATPVVPVFPWRPFVVAALLFTLTVGALTGAIDLWHLRVSLTPVPVDHHRAHGFAQLFGFLWLFTMGVSLHLAPRFFGSPPATRARRLVLAWCGIGGVALLVAGRLGDLVPGATLLSITGATLVLVAMTAWAGLLANLWIASPAAGDALHRFMAAGVAWWWVAALQLLLWTIGQAMSGPIAGMPLEPVWAAAMLGGTGSWLWGIFFRAGVCTLHVERPGEAAQRRLFTAWQAASALAVVAAWVPAAWLGAVAQLAAAVAVGLVWWTVRPFSGEGVGEEPSLAPRSVQAGLVFMLAFAALSAWGALAALGLWAPPLLRDATRHAFTLGGATLLVLGFAGRMVPGFSGNSLRWPRAYDTGVLALGASAALRLGELFGVSRLGWALSGVSGGLAFIGLALVAGSLLGSMRPKVAPVPAPLRALQQGAVRAAGSQ